MTTYIYRRLITGSLVIAAVLVSMFLLTHSMGDPVELMVSEEVPLETKERLREELGLNRPLHVQFLSFVGGVVRGDFGVSLRDGRPSLSLFIDRFPATVQLGLTAIAIAFAGGTILGVVSGYRVYSFVDRVTTVLTSVAMSSVDFWIATMLILFMAVYLGWLPTSGYGTWQHLVMPAFVLSLRPLGRIAQVTRGAVAGQRDSYYAVAARARGLSESRIRWGYVARNASAVIITFAGIEAIHLLNGSVVIEVVFAWPGVGLLAADALTHRDWPVVVTVATLIALMVVLVNVCIDIIYAWLDPRVRLR